MRGLFVWLKIFENIGRSVPPGSFLAKLPLSFLCPAHPLWDEKNPSMYKKKLEKYIPQQQRRDRDIKQQKVNIWKTKGIKEDGTRYKILSPHVGLKKNEEL